MVSILSMAATLPKDMHDTSRHAACWSYIRRRPGDLSELQLRRNVPDQRASRVQKRDVGLRGKASAV